MLPNPALKILLAHQGLKLERSRCVQHRFKPAGCDRCFKVCPTGAIRWTDDGLFWEQADCQHCLLCVAVCPTAALSAKELLFVQVIKKLAAEKKPVLACGGQPATAGHVRLPCLGLLGSPELLLVLSLALGRSYNLNLTRCGDCPNAAILPYLKTAAAQVGKISDNARLIYAEQDLDFHEAGVSRREFFSMLRRSSEVAVCSLADQLYELPERSFGDKSLPSRRLLLLQILKQLPTHKRTELAARLFPAMEISSDSCSGCSGCVGLCPTGALHPAGTTGKPPSFVAQNCTECGLCTAFCKSDSIRIVAGELGRMSATVELQFSARGSDM